VTEGPHLLVEMPDGKRMLLLDAELFTAGDLRPSPEAEAAINDPNRRYVSGWPRTHCPPTCTCRGEH
jgi:hypothetical protein